MKKKYYIYWHPRGQKRGSFNQNRSIIESESGPMNKEASIKRWKKQYPNRVFEKMGMY